MRKKDVYTEIEQKLLEPKPHVVVGALIRAGLVTWGRGEYEGKMNYCLQCTFLNDKIRNGDTNTEQTENATIQIESSVKGNAEMGEYYQHGRRYYRDSNGDSHTVPLDAPERPNPKALWDGEQWREPDAAMQKQPIQSQTEPSVGVIWYSGGYYGYMDKKGNICKDYDGNILYIPKKDAYNRPSINHVYDFEVCKWCLPDELTVIESTF